MERWIISFGISFIGSIILLPLVRYWGLAYGFTDKPGHRKIHQNPIPALGGVVVFLAISSYFYVAPTHAAFINWSLLIILAAVLFITGFLDDKLDLPALLRLFIQLSCAALIVFNGVQLQTLFGLSAILEQNDLFMKIITILLITGIVNAFNLIDGLDGLSGGLSFISASVIAVIAFMTSHHDLGIFMLILSGMLLAFLAYNFHPAKLFMGDSGSLVLGFIFSTISIQLIDVNATYELSITQPIVLLSIVMLPVLDTLRLFVYRISKRRSPFSADKNHIHHIVLGDSKNFTATSYRIYGLHVLMIVTALFCTHISFYTTLILLIVEYFLFLGYFKRKKLTIIPLKLLKIS